MTRLKWFFVWSLCLLAAGVAYAEDAPTLAGHWQGAIELPGMELEFNIDFTQNADGAWQGDISIPVQKAKDLPLGDITMSEGKVGFTMPGVPGEPAFEGTFNDSGEEISGTFTQGGQAFPFSMTSREDPTIAVNAALEGFDTVIEEALEKFKVPGLALAVVKADKIVLTKGYGFRDYENKLPVTENTLMAIGSSSKAFTTCTMGVLVDQGKLEWDTPVREYIPWFKLQKLFLSEHLTPRDMVTHRSGLPRHDLVWYNNTEATRKDLVQRLAFLEPSADLRERFQYNNLMFLTSGFLVETLTGKTWEESVRALVFDPLGMKRSNFSVDDSQTDDDFAFPYVEKDDKIIKIPFRNISTIGPAGSINSCARDMAQWLLLHLNDGAIDGEQIVNAATIQEMHQCHMTFGGAASTRADIFNLGYGMGWFLDMYRGHKRVHHGGNIDGFSALVSMIPDERLGFVVLTNKNATGLTELVVRHATDRILGLEKEDWIGEALDKAEKGEKVAKEAEKKKELRRKKGTKPSHKRDDYAGDYFHPGYGTLTVSKGETGLSFTYNGITTPLEHFHYDIFNGKETKDPTFEDMKLSFGTDLNGNIAQVTAPFEQAVDPIVFVKQGDAKLSDPKYMQKLIGKYELMDQVLTILMQGDTLMLQVPGQPAYELEPALGGEYRLKLAKLYSMAFIEDADGYVTALELYQPNGTFTAKRMAEEKVE